MATTTQDKTTMVSPSEQKNRVKKEESVEILNFIKHMAEAKHLVKISKEDGVHIMQTTLFFFKHPQYLSEGQYLINLLIDRIGCNTYKEDFDDIDELIERLCAKSHTKTVFDQMLQK